MEVQKSLWLMLQARRTDNQFFESRRYMRRPCIEEGKAARAIEDVWDALAMLTRPFNENTHRTVRLVGAVHNPHQHPVLQVYVPGSWRRNRYDYPISEEIIKELFRGGYLDETTFFGLPYNRAFILNERGMDALHDHLFEAKAA